MTSVIRNNLNRSVSPVTATIWYQESKQVHHIITGLVVVSIAVVAVGAVRSTIAAVVVARAGPQPLPRKR
jgi:hypothetical protein